MSQQNKNSDHKRINQFVSSLANSDFSTANKYLKSIIENKLLKKINTFKHKPLF
jgi:hypothetical protein